MLILGFVLSTLAVKTLLVLKHKGLVGSPFRFCPTKHRLQENSRERERKEIASSTRVKKSSGRTEQLNSLKETEASYRAVGE